MLRVLYFDLETKLSADEVGGWENIVDMGMSCGVVYDSQTQRYEQYAEDEVMKLIGHLRQGELVVGFNHIRFDLMVLAGSEVEKGAREQLYGELCSLNNFDIMVELQKLLGHRVGLDALARATLQESKSSSGLQALQWYKEGKLKELMDYCIKDVEITRRVHQYALQHQKLSYESRGEIKSVALSWSLPEEKTPDLQQGSLL